MVGQELRIVTPSGEVYRFSAGERCRIGASDCEVNLDPHSFESEWWASLRWADGLWRIRLAHGVVAFLGGKPVSPPLTYVPVDRKLDLVLRRANCEYILAVEAHPGPLADNGFVVCEAQARPGQIQPPGTGGIVAERYWLGDLIGRGGTSQVFEAEDRQLGRRVAIKIVDLMASPEMGLRKRFEREVAVTVRLRHRGIVTILDAGLTPSYGYMVMDLINGRDLARILREDGPLSVAEALRVGACVADALVAAHAIPIVHRDIKPANIMLEGESVMLLDFGIALLSADAGAHITPPATAVGTIAYFSPEQALGQCATTASDIYALGGVLFAMLTGRSPYVGDSSAQIASRHVNDPVPLVRELRPDVPAELEELVRSMLRKDPQDRPSAAEVLLLLKRVQAPGSARNIATPAEETQVLPSADKTKVLPTSNLRDPIHQRQWPSPSPPQRRSVGPISLRSNSAVVKALKTTAFWMSIVALLLLLTVIIIAGKF